MKSGDPLVTFQVKAKPKWATLSSWRLWSPNSSAVQAAFVCLLLCVECRACRLPRAEGTEGRPGSWTVPPGTQILFKINPKQTHAWPHSSPSFSSWSSCRVLSHAPCPHHYQVLLRVSYLQAWMLEKRAREATWGGGQFFSFICYMDLMFASSLRYLVLNLTF